MKHTVMHLLGCLLPLLVIFLLPLFGLGEGAGLFLVIVLMFACHLFMMGGHGHKHDGLHSQTGGHTHAND